MEQNTDDGTAPIGTLIAVGFTAQVFAWKQGWVLKLFNQGISRPAVEGEARLSRLVHASSLPVPAVGEIIEIGDRFGLEYGRVDGISMLQALMQQPWKFELFAHQLARLQAQVHTIHLPEMPSLREMLEQKIRRAEKLHETVRQAAIRLLTALPEDDRLCHGDFHPGNILLSTGGPVIIDWIDAARGSPILDVARSTLLFGGALPPSTPPLVRIVRSWFYRRYLHNYCQLNPIDRQALGRWIPLVAAARLDENISFDEQRLLALAHKLVE